MSDRTLRELKASIENLELVDQVRLFEYLAPKIAGAVLASRDKGASAEHAQQAIPQYRSAGEQLAATSAPGAPSLTEAISQMRR